MMLKPSRADIPEAEVRAIYLREVAENAQLLELAEKWRLDIAGLTQVTNNSTAAAAEDDPIV
jgi:hypothetical protein